MLLKIFIAILLILTYIFLRWMLQKKKFPPGPPCLPIVGCLPFLKNSEFKHFFDEAYAAKYGDLVSFYLGFIHIIVCNNYYLAKELFSRDDLANRIDNWYTINSRGNTKFALGIIHTNGQFWREQKRFALKRIRDFGCNRKGNNFIQEECLALIKFFLKTSQEKENENDVFISKIFHHSMLNVMWQFLASIQFERDSYESVMMIEKLDEIFKHEIPLKRFIFPFLNDILPSTILNTNTKLFRASIRKIVIEIQSIYDPKNPPENFIEAYLNEICKGKNSSYSIEQLEVVCHDFLVPGVQTTGTSLMWAVMFMALNPRAQTQCQEEIDDVLGKNGLPCLQNMKDLPWCQATLLEIQRLARMLKLSVDHYATNDVSLGNNVVIPKGAIVFMNIGKILMDPICFPNPEEFRPERFLTENREIKKPDLFVPFGVGKRMCMGESLAQHELFIFLVMMLQKLNFSPPKSHSTPNVNNFSDTIIRIPYDFFINITPRV